MSAGMRGWLFLSVLLGFATLGGCAALKSLEPGGSEYWVKPGSPRPANEVESLLTYFEYAKKLPGPDLNREHERIKQTFVNGRSDFTRLRYALLLTMPNSTFRDEGRALALLEPLLKEGAAASPALRSFAYFLNAGITEHRRIEESANQKLREEQKRSETLEQKLDAIKSIEKTIIEREQNKPLPRR